jgi:hypothetical protein
MRWTGFPGSHSLQWTSTDFTVANEKKKIDVPGVILATRKEGTPNGTSKETFQGVIVEGTKSIWYHMTVVLRMNMHLLKLVEMYEAMNEIIPSAHHQHCNHHLSWLHN